MSLAEVYEEIRECALLPDLRVVLYGESGAGKSLVAKEYARALGRGTGRSLELVHVNCAVLDPELAAAELFGASRGAYTGSAKDRPGLIERADGGVLFLDEVHELPRTVQAKLLTWLDTKEFRRVGEVDTRSVSRCHVLAATNADLVALARDGVFKHDLVHRLCQLEVRLPSLRDRPDDAEMVACEAAAKVGLALAPDALEWVLSGAWEWDGIEGNARRLQNAVYQAGIRARRLGAPAISARDFGEPPRVAASLSEPVERTIAREQPGISTEELAARIGRHPNTARDRAKKAGLVKAKGREGGWYLPE